MGRNDPTLFTRKDADYIMTTLKWLKMMVKHLLARGDRRRGGGGALPPGVVLAGAITAVTEDNTPACDHTYAAKSISGRKIEDEIAPDRPFDTLVKYAAAAVDDPCYMWWDADGTGHIHPFTEVPDYITDS